ncbi:septum formation family protein, partial [Frankia sp. CN6]
AFSTGGSGPAAAPVPSGAASATTDPELTDRTYERGRCYLWDLDGASSKVDEVDCAEPHRFEAVSDNPVSMAASFPPDAPFPATDDEWSRLADEHCGAPVAAYLGSPLDPYGRFGISTIRPTEEGWALGDRDLQCGIGGYAPTAENPDNDLVSGSAKGADQSMVYGPGTCLVEDADGLYAVTCATAHHHVAIGDVHLPGAPGSPPPTDDAFDEQAARECATVAGTFFGGPFQETDSVYVGWFTLSPESWAAGSRSFSCLVSYVTPTGDPRPVTGDARNPIPA